MRLNSFNKYSLFQAQQLDLIIHSIRSFSQFEGDALPTVIVELRLLSKITDFNENN